MGKTLCSHCGIYEMGSELFLHFRVFVRMRLFGVECKADFLLKEYLEASILLRLYLGAANVTEFRQREMRRGDAKWCILYHLGYLQIAKNQQVSLQHWGILRVAKRSYTSQQTTNDENEIHWPFWFLSAMWILLVCRPEQLLSCSDTLAGTLKAKSMTHPKKLTIIKMKRFMVLDECWNTCC